MKPSRYNIFVPLRQGRLLAYNGFTGGFALWEKHEQEMYQFVASGKAPNLADPAVRQLIQGGYLVANYFDELALLEEQYKAHRFNEQAMILTIAPTLSCNFGCDYCFQGQNKPNQTMSQEVQDAIISLVERSVPNINHLHVAWYGGEPLLQLKIIEALSDRFIGLCDARGIKYDAMMVTNGYRLNVDVAKSLYVRRLKTVQVTLDGAREDHDLRRVLLSGKPSFDSITQNLREIVDSVPIPFSIRVNIDHRNQDRIRGLIDHLAEMGFGNRQTVRLYFAPVEAMTEGCHNVASVCMTKRQYGSLEADLYWYAFEKGLTSLPYPPRFHGVCGAVRPNAFVITPTGDIHKCWDTVTFPQHTVGSIFNMEAVVQNEKTQQWIDWTPFVNDTCRNCKILPNCSGACAYKFIHSQETRGEAAVLPCPSWKYNIKERLVLRAVKMGAITADDYDLEMIKTEPSELCADVHMPGQALPPEMATMYAVSAK